MQKNKEEIWYTIGNIESLYQKLILMDIL